MQLYTEQNRNLPPCSNEDCKKSWRITVINSKETLKFIHLWIYNNSLNMNSTRTFRVIPDEFRRDRNEENHKISDTLYMTFRTSSLIENWWPGLIIGNNECNHLSHECMQSFYGALTTITTKPTHSGNPPIPIATPESNHTDYQFGCWLSRNDIASPRRAQLGWD